MKLQFQAIIDEADFDGNGTHKKFLNMGDSEFISFLGLIDYTEFLTLMSASSK